VLVLGEWGGRLRYEPPPAPRPTRYHLSLDFADGSVLSATTQMWGAAELYVQGEEGSRQYIKDMRSTPLDPEFTPDYFEALVAEAAALKKSAKGLLTQGQLVPGLGNSSAQDILFRAGLDPRRAVATLAPVQRRAMYGAREIIAAGGRYDETDLYGAPGGYVRLMDKNAVARPCPACGGPILQISYLGGACYLCPNCQG
jgi:formamidopyrimidine-DNA glycosylase